MKMFPGPDDIAPFFGWSLRHARRKMTEARKKLEKAQLSVGELANFFGQDPVLLFICINNESPPKALKDYWNEKLESDRTF